MRKGRKSILYFIFFIAFMVIMLFSGVVIDEILFPAIYEIAVIKAKESAGRCIDNAVSETIKEMDAVYSDFFIFNEYEASFSINTMLINEFTLKVNENIRKELTYLSEVHVKIPFGAVTGIKLFSSEGPEISIEIMPYGEVMTDYDTEVISSGINQTAVKVWIETRVHVSIVHPLIDKKAEVSRKVMLIDTVIKGDVPGGYIYGPK